MGSRENWFRVGLLITCFAMNSNVDAVDLKKLGASIFGEAKNAVEDVGQLVKNKTTKGEDLEENVSAVDDPDRGSSGSQIVEQSENKLVFENGAQYKGDIVDELPHGVGTLDFPDGSVYEGEWVRGVREGRGTLTSSNGDVYEGEFQGNKLHGTGTKRFANGIVYEGEAREGNFTGQGKLTVPNGAWYEGEFLNGSYEGIGTLHYANGDRYVGEFSQNMLNGIGTLFKVNGDVIKAEWKDDQFVDYETIESSPRFKEEVATSGGMSVKIYDHSIQPTNLPARDAQLSEVVVKGFALNMTEQDFASRVTELGESDGSCLVNGQMKSGVWMNNSNDNSRSSDPYERFHMSKCFTRGSLYAAWFFDGRAKKIGINTLGSTTDVAAALRERYGSPTETIDMRGKGQDVVVSDEESAYVFNSGDLVHREYWLIEDATLELNLFPPEAELTIYDSAFHKELANRMRDINQKKISTLLD